MPFGGDGEASVLTFGEEDKCQFADVVDATATEDMNSIILTPTTRGIVTLFIEYSTF